MNENFVRDWKKEREIFYKKKCKQTAKDAKTKQNKA